MATQVFECGGVLTYQLLCGREIAVADKLAVQMANYCYLVVNSHDRTALVVDAAWDVKGIYDLASQLGVKIRGAIYTHYHFDHCGGEVDQRIFGKAMKLPGALEVHEAGGMVWAGKGDAEQIRNQCKLVSPGAVQELEDGDVLDCGDLVLHILRTPGHTPGSICVFAAPRCLSPRGALGATVLQESVRKAEAGLLMTGDTLFVGSCGRTDLPGSDQEAMFKSLARVSMMDSNVLVCPGHNYAKEPVSTIAAERLQNGMMKMGLMHYPRPPALPPCFACGTGATCGPKAFVIGRKVRVKGLSSDAGLALNDKEAVVESFESDKERYAVRLLGSSEVKVIKPENLTAPSPTSPL